MTFLDVIILIKSVFDKDKNSYYYKISSEKSFYVLSRKYVFVQIMKSIL